MPDLTDSYCERCGARYVFNPNAPKAISLKGARVLARGLKNFVLTDGQSMADAMALARNDDDHQDSTRATEAFHRTFNFCMTCRQYACDACWNVKVGACLSCAPEAGVEAVAPQDHLIVRTPVANWDEDWSLFPDGPAVEPLASSEPPPPFHQPIQLPEPRTTPPAQPPAGQAWPAADLPVEAPAVVPGPGGKSGHRSSRKTVDAEAASLWPLADEIAPEMTLTPEELELVESRLGEDALADIGQATQVTPEPRAPEPVTPAKPRSRGSEAGVWAASKPPIPEQPAAKLAPAPSPIDRAPEPQGSPEHLLHLRFDARPQPPRSHAAPPATPTEHAPMVSRLLGRHTAEETGSGTAQPRRGRGRHNQPAGDPWPHVTMWSERPVEVHDWWGEGEAAAALAGSEATHSLPIPAADLPSTQGQASSAPTLGQVTRDAAPPSGLHDGVDARSAAEVRLTAVGGLADNPVVQPPETPEPAPFAEAPFLDAPFPESPFPETDSSAADWIDADWLEADREAIGRAKPPVPPEAPERPRLRREAAPSPRTAPPEPPTPAPAPANPWPPLGASLPAQRAPDAPWPPPETAPVPAILVAAQGSPDPTLAEMWAQSAQEVLNRGSVRVCYRCALPVSTQARFCRRCGTRQS